MSDLYRELLVKREPTSSQKALGVVLVAATVLSAVAILFQPIALIALVALAVVDYLKLPAIHTEFEYLYVNGELDVDRILSRSKRKRAASYEMGKLELLAPCRSNELDSYRQKNLKTVDFSSGTQNQNVYTMVYNGSKGMELVLLELDEIILNDIRRIAPRKVKLG